MVTMSVVISLLYSILSPIWMIPQIFIFGIYRLPLNLLHAVLRTLGLQYNTQLLMEFGIVLYQYITIAFIIGAFFGIFNLFLFFIVKYLISLIDQMFRFDTNSLFAWLNVEEPLKEKEKEKELEKEKSKDGKTPVINKKSTKSKLDQTMHNDKKENKDNQDKKKDEINLNQEKEQKKKQEKNKENTKDSSMSPLEQPAPPKLPERPIDTKIAIELMPNIVQTSTTQTCKYKDVENIPRVRVPHTPHSTEESTTIDSSKSDDNESQTADTSFQTEQTKH